MAADPPLAAEKGEMAPGTRVRPTAPPPLNLVRRLQAKLKMHPLWALRLLRCLQDAARQVSALGDAVEALLAALGPRAASPGLNPRPPPPLTPRASSRLRCWASVGAASTSSCTEADLGQLSPGGPA